MTSCLHICVNQHTRRVHVDEFMKTHPGFKCHSYREAVRDDEYHKFVILGAGTDHLHGLRWTHYKLHDILTEQLPGGWQHFLLQRRLTEYGTESAPVAPPNLTIYDFCREKYGHCSCEGSDEMVCEGTAAQFSESAFLEARGARVRKEEEFEKEQKRLKWEESASGIRRDIFPGIFDRPTGFRDSYAYVPLFDPAAGKDETAVQVQGRIRRSPVEISDETLRKVATELSRTRESLARKMYAGIEPVFFDEFKAYIPPLDPDELRYRRTGSIPKDKQQPWHRFLVDPTKGGR